ncbi:MAG: NfeD family protein, partial [Firmicutes bacterium]|nr:NfeD family protein [Bacillota bacterium]
MFGISAALFWGILSAVFLAAEAVTVGFVSVWFCLVALITVFAAKAGASVIVQMAVFIVVSSALLVLTRPFV